MFSYISGSSFVLEGRYGMSPQTFSLVFGLSAASMLVASQLNRRLLDRFRQRSLMFAGLIGSVSGAVCLFVALAVGAGLLFVQPSLVLIVGSAGFIAPNVAGLALAGHARAAGSASSLIGMTQFLAGAIAGPLTGLGRGHRGMPMATTILACSSAAMLCALLTCGLVRPAPIEPDALPVAAS